MLALALKLLIPPGYMPGTSLAQPIILCPGQGTMTMGAEAMAPMSMAPMSTTMHHGGDHAPSKAPHDNNDHSCAFAGLATAPLAAGFDDPLPVPAIVTAAQVMGLVHVAAPGRGMAAPPPPSHAPPVFRA